VEDDLRAPEVLDRKNPIKKYISKCISTKHAFQNQGVAESAGY
jgi:hypothetical protein